MAPGKRDAPFRAVWPAGLAVPLGGIALAHNNMKRLSLLACCALLSGCAMFGRVKHTVTGDVSVISMNDFMDGRKLRVYLPPGYHSGSRRYPVLYMMDGQNLFDAATSFAGEWRVDETCDALIRAGEIEPLIVVGIDNAGQGRIAEYTPWPDPKYGGGDAAGFLAELKGTLKPAIDRLYRTRPEPAHTFIGGSSLGGLISAYAGYSDPGTWGGVIAMSPSYWWDGERFAAWAAGRRKPALRFFYQDMGDSEKGADPGVEDYIGTLRRVRKLALSQGFREGEDLFSVEAAGHSHSEKYWAERFPLALRRLLPAR